MAIWGSGWVRKRGRIWYVGFCHRGREFEGSSRCLSEGRDGTDKAQACELLRARMADVGRIHRNTLPLRFSDLCQIFLADQVTNERKDLRGVKLSIRTLSAFFGQDQAHEITSPRVAAYVEARRKSVKPGTINRELAALRRMFRLALRQELVEKAPYIPRFKPARPRQGFFTPREVDALVGALPLEIAVLVQFARITGWRRGEIVGLTWRDVDFESGEIRLRDSKSGEGRTLPFAAIPQLEGLIRDQRRRAFEVGAATVFFGPTGGPIGDFRDAWRDGCAAAGVPGRLFHDLRRTAVREMERAGVPRSQAMRITGHKTESVYRAYAIVSGDDLVEALRKRATRL